MSQVSHRIQVILEPDREPFSERPGLPTALIGPRKVGSRGSKLDVVNRTWQRERELRYQSTKLGNRHVGRIQPCVQANQAQTRYA